VSWHFVCVYFVPLVLAVVANAALCDRSRLNVWSSTASACWVAATGWACFQYWVAWSFCGPRMLRPAAFAAAWATAGLSIIWLTNLARRALE
jgi:hypothetical protein